MTKLWLFCLLLGFSGCFKPVIYFGNKDPKYPVAIFYAGQKPQRAYTPIRELETRTETVLTPQQNANRRMLKRGNDMQDKEVMLGKMALDAKKLGADALINVRYTYFTDQTTDGYVLTGLAVRYQAEP